MIALDYLDIATKAGTLPMQVILLLGIIALGLVLRHLHTQNNKTIADFTKRIDDKENAMSDERRARIDMLLRRMEEDTKVKSEMRDALRHNTEAIKEFISEQKTMILGFENFIISQTEIITNLCQAVARGNK